MKRKMIVGFTLLFFISMITGCSHSLKDEQKDAINNAEKVFSDKEETAKDESKELNFYLPFGMSIKEESPNNVIIKKGGNDYILFYNQNENNNSKVVYEMSKPENDIIVDKPFKKKNKFGFLIVSKVNKELFEVTVGIGGIKMTTESKVKNIADNAEIMMKIVSSVQYKK